VNKEIIASVQHARMRDVPEDGSVRQKHVSAAYMTECQLNIEHAQDN
jgi:hypothetical protein